MEQINKRLEYIDALRGFTMILVVTCHITGWSQIQGNIFVDGVVGLFRMPMFFFISGFILYKDSFSWNISNWFSFIKKKAKVQLVTTALIMTIYSWYNSHSLLMYFCDANKWGYWFTITLFMYFLFYSSIRLMLDRYGKKVSAIFCFILGLLIWKYLLSQGIRDAVSIFNILSVDKLKYFVFFVFGTIVKQYFNQFKYLIDNKYFMLFIIFTFLIFSKILPVSCDFSFYNRYQPLIAGFLGIILTFTFFRKNEEAFSKNNYIGKSLQYIGRRTLDIYFLHYFLIPHDIGAFGNVFTETSSAPISFLFRFCIALIIIGFCLLISNILRLSPFIAEWLFGAKQK